MGTSPRSSLAPVLRLAEVRAVEAGAADTDLMERAGEAAATLAERLCQGRSGPVVVLAGPGNNGGDGFVVARRLRQAFHEVQVVFRDDPARLPPDAAAAYAALVASGGVTLTEPPDGRVALVIDALFGIGLTRALATPHRELVEWCNDHPAPVLALDIPTGLDPDTGTVRAPAVEATATATFIALKPGLLTAQGPDLSGELTVHALGLEVAVERAAQGRALEWSALAQALPEILHRRAGDTHKGTFGTLHIVGGADGMTGALLLAGRAALRSGAGKVRLGFLAQAAPGVDPAMPELMLGDAHALLGANADAVVAGCGLGTGASAHELLESILMSNIPLVLDADALNLLAGDLPLSERVRARSAPTLLTPHPAEAARLLHCSVETIARDRLAAATELSTRWSAHVVLKGRGSVLAHPEGGFAINCSGNPALASAGSGDVLAGVLGALLAQGIDARTALQVGVCLHGASADALVARGIGPVGVGASELPDAARDLVNQATRGARR